MTLARVAIFGATSAIAQAVARRLAAGGTRLHLVGRDPAKLAAVRDDLAARGAVATMAVADLDESERHEALLDEAERLLGGLDGALVAQGTLPDQAACEASFERTQAEWRTNFVAPASLAARLANRFEARGAGVIAAISSVAGDRGRKSNYVYGTAKGALSTFLQGLRGRLHGKGVRVVTIKPGFVDTPMTAAMRKGPLWATADGVAAGIVTAMERADGEVYLPRFWALVMFAIRHIPERIFVRLNI